jgi:hypothetical protein
MALLVVCNMKTFYNCSDKCDGRQIKVSAFKGRRESINCAEVFLTAVGRNPKQVSDFQDS